MLTTPEEKINSCIHWAKEQLLKAENGEDWLNAKRYFDGYITGARMVAKMLNLEVDGVEKR